MPGLEAYGRHLAYSYAPGVFPALLCLEHRADCARRLLVHSQSGRNEGVAQLEAACQRLGVRVETADRALRRISGKDNCYAALVFEKYADALSPMANHVVLHQPSDMGNLGTILRSLLGFGFLDLAILQPAADPFDPRVARASMGALFGLRLQQFADFDAYRAAHPNHALHPFMLDGALPLTRAARAAKAPYALVFGNEATGLPASFSGLGQAVRIVHSPAIDSLNLAVAVSIAAHAYSAWERDDSHVLGL